VLEVAAWGIKVALVVLAQAAANTADRERNKMSSTNPKDLLALPELNSEPYRGLTKAMERSPRWEAKSPLTGQGISRILS
jgi:hypothetical protein